MLTENVYRDSVFTKNDVFSFKNTFYGIFAAF